MSKWTNPYLHVPMDRLRRDAVNGVRLAIAAWRVRDPDGAAKVLGRVVEPQKQSGNVRK